MASSARASSFFSSPMGRLSALAVTVPPVFVWLTDCFYSFSVVRGTSMEPSLTDGDVVLVRKCDAFPALDSSSDTDQARIARVEASVGNGPSYVYNRPPLVLPGHVVVMYDPHVAFPHALMIKRVVGLGGQIVRPTVRMRHVESIPRYSLWVEGDNAQNSQDSNKYGPISKKLLVGKAQCIVWPPSRWGVIEKKPPPHGRAWWP